MLVPLRPEPKTTQLRTTVPSLDGMLHRYEALDITKTEALKMLLGKLEESLVHC